MVTKVLSDKLIGKHKSEGNKRRSPVVSWQNNSPDRRSSKYKYYETEICLRKRKEAGVSVSETEDRSTDLLRRPYHSLQYD